MKQLDWKSLAIGVLLTTTVILGTGTTRKYSDNRGPWRDDWDGTMRWAVTQTSGMEPDKVFRNGEEGWHPFHVKASINPDDTIILWRKRTF